MSKARNKQKTKKAPIPLWVWGLAGAVLIALVAFFVWRQLNPGTSPAEAALPVEITVPQAAEKRDQGAFILDVRQPEEWEQFHIPGATLIPLGDLPARLSEVPQDQDVVVVCRTGRRSAEGRDILLAAGYPRVTSMAGGVTEWQAQGLPIATGK